MKVVRDDNKGVFVLVPVESHERETFAQLVAIAKKGDTFTYGGRLDEGKYCKIFLHFRAKEKARVRKSGCVTVHDTVLVGGIRVVVQGTTRAHKVEVGRFRDSCYFGGCSPIFMGTVKIKKENGIAVTLKLCKHCKAPMVRLGECEWSTCEACANKCRHKYETGVVHGGSAGSGALGKYCIKCGRSKKGSVDTKKSDAEHKVEIQKALGISWVYTDTSLTPAQIVFLEQFARVAKK